MKKVNENRSIVTFLHTLFAKGYPKRICEPEWIDFLREIHAGVGRMQNTLRWDSKPW